MKFQLEIGTAYVDEGDRPGVKWRVTLSDSRGEFVAESVEEDLGLAADKAIKVAMFDRVEELEEQMAIEAERRLAEAERKAKGRNDD